MRGRFVAVISARVAATVAFAAMFFFFALRLAEDDQLAAAFVTAMLSCAMVPGMAILLLVGVCALGAIIGVIFDLAAYVRAWASGLFGESRDL